jgi:tryptophan 2,3-dioxygenase
VTECDNRIRNKQTDAGYAREIIVTFIDSCRLLPDRHPVFIPIQSGTTSHCLLSFDNGASDDLLRIEPGPPGPVGRDALVKRKNDGPALPGEGDTDYARYMRTDALLDLQRSPGEVIHRDELLFQVTHQSTELWLKLAASELAEAIARIDAGDPAAAELLLVRATLAVRLVTDQLDMLGHLHPADFQAMQPALGNGSGAESPGWRQTQAAGRRLGLAFTALLAGRGIDLATLYAGEPSDPAYRLGEAMVEFDDRVSAWRVRHYKIAIRVGGHGVIGTAGSPSGMLAKLIDYRFFPELWQVRTTRGGVG